MNSVKCEFVRKRLLDPSMRSKKRRAMMRKKMRKSKRVMMVM